MLFRSVLTRDGFTVTLTLPEDLPPVRADATALGLMLNNLIDNAIRYGARGKQVKLQASASVTHVTVMVSDRGPGIPKEDVPFIFQPFYVVGQDPDTQAQGGGLGLCLARGVMDVHGGTLECDSGRGGTTMTLRFPRDFQRESVPSPSRPPARRRK